MKKHLIKSIKKQRINSTLSCIGILAFALFFPHIVVVASEQLLENSGFEDGLNGWTTPAIDGGMSQASPDAANSGKLGLLVADEDEEGGSELLSSRVPASEGQLLRVRFQGKIVSGRGLTVYLVFYDQAGAPLNAAKFGNEIFTLIEPRFPDWNRYQFEGIAPAGTASAGIRVHSIIRERVTAHLDDFSIEKVDREAEDKANVEIAAEHLRPILYELLDGWRASHPDLKLEVLDVAPVCSDFRVGFALHTKGSLQYAAFYDPKRRMTVAQRDLAESAWRIRALPSLVGHDNHNFIALGFDRGGHLHVSGNMHGQPLVYFRSTRPHDLESIEPIHLMTGINEDRVTYPRFYNLPDGRLVFSYRQGGSDDGRMYFNIYDEDTRTWTRFLDTLIFDGEGKRNAYPVGLGPVLGKDGNYHLSWVWRDSRMCETNHSLSYARSRNLVDWETIDGRSVNLPITVNTPGVMVDPVPVRGGIINGTGRVGFDQDGRLLITYHKYDAKGLTQMYIASWEDGTWKHTQASDWNYRWDFHGDGSISFEIVIGQTEVIDNRLGVFIRHINYDSGFYLLDPVTLKLGERVPGKDMPWNYRPLPDALYRVQSPFPGMQVNWTEDSGDSPSGKVHRLRWETLPTNRDKPHSIPTPPPTMLRLITVKKVGQ